MLELEEAPVPELVELQGRQVDPVLNDPETGVWGMGTGWEMGLIALDRFLRGEMPDGYDAESFEATPEIVELANRCDQEWAAPAQRTHVPWGREFVIARSQCPEAASA